MNATVTVQAPGNLGGTESATERVAGSAAVSRSSRVLMLGATSIVIGILWDISWHRTIGRDTFWTPAHMAIYLGGLLGGLTAVWLVLRCTFRGTTADKAAAVGIFGLRGPLGAWVSGWGSLAMLTSAPFDNWWHDAYGLDVKILSPPHTVLALGMFAIVIGALLLVLREQNLAPPGSTAPGARLLLYAGGVIVAMVSTFLTEESWPNMQRNHSFHLIAAATYPFYLMALARASRHRWAATLTALGYMAIQCGMLWILPLFPGEPRLGPIYNPIHHFVPLPFPLLLIVPAFALDLLRRWIGHDRGWRRDWALCVLGGAVVAGSFALTQWYFASFLIGPGAQNWFFGADRYWDYMERLGDYRSQFWSGRGPGRGTQATATTFALVVLFGVVSSRMGLWLGNGMARVRR